MNDFENGPRRGGREIFDIILKASLISTLSVTANTNIFEKVVNYVFVNIFVKGFRKLTT